MFFEGLGFFGQKPRKNKQEKFYKPNLEELENRLSPANLNFTFRGEISDLWNEPNNWDRKAVPDANDHIVFDSKSRNSTNNLLPSIRTFHMDQKFEKTVTFPNDTTIRDGGTFFDGYLAIGTGATLKLGEGKDKL